MSKIQIPAEYKAFEDKFSALAYGQDDSKVFDDMLTFIIDLFSFDNPWKPHGRYKDPEIRKRFLRAFSGDSTPDEQEGTRRRGVVRPLRESL